jgi:hypothetical protein
MMGIMALEGIVKDGQIQLMNSVRLPENTKVYIVVPEIQVPRVVHIYSPRLAHPEQAKDFQLEIVEEQTDAAV